MIMMMILTTTRRKITEAGVGGFVAVSVPVVEDTHPVLGFRRISKVPRALPHTRDVRKNSRHYGRRLKDTCLKK